MEIAVGSRPGTPQRGEGEAHVAEVVAPGIVLFAVAHGFGTIRDRATPAIAVAAIRENLKRRARVERRDPRHALATAFAAANARVFAHSGSTDDHVASGTSVTAALIVGDHAFVGHVGATCAYLCRDGELSALTTDDALGDGPARLLTKTLGTQPALDPAVTHVRLMHGDALVLSSGALHVLLRDDEIADALRASASSEAATSRLLAMAGVRGAGAGTVIVGRALHDIALGPRGRRPSARETSIVLAVMFAATIAAKFVLHAFLSAG